MTEQPRHKALPLPFTSDVEGMNPYRLASEEKIRRQDAGIDEGGRHKLEKPEPTRRSVGASALARFVPQIGIRKA